MGRRIIVDPITRIEGHLRIDVEVDKGAVQSAWSSGQMSPIPLSEGTSCTAK